MTIEPKIDWGIFGNRISQKRARAALPILIRYAQKKSTITFGALANAIAAPKPLHYTMRQILACINTELFHLTRSDSWAFEENPTLTAIVVDRNGMPSDWMQEQMRERNIETKKEVIKENYDHYLVQPVFKYQHWDKVIDAIINSPNW